MRISVSICTSKRTVLCMSDMDFLSYPRSGRHSCRVRLWTVTEEAHWQVHTEPYSWKERCGLTTQVWGSQPGWVNMDSKEEGRKGTQGNRSHAFSIVYLQLVLSLCCASHWRVSVTTMEDLPAVCLNFLEIRHLDSTKHCYELPAKLQEVL